MSFAIFTDTSANLPTQYVKEHDVTVIPFTYFIGDDANQCMNTDEFNGPEFYSAMRAGREVTTSQINPDVFMSYMEPRLRTGEDVLYIGMSSGISGAYNSAQIAMSQLREQYPERSIRLVDTLGASLGEGLWVLKAVQMKENGESISRIADTLHAERHHMYQIFVVDELKYLQRSGRIHGAAAAIGTLLNIKPILKGDHKGRIVSYAKVRGMRKALETLAARYDELVSNAESQTIGIAHADAPEACEKLVSLLKRNHPAKEILTVCYEPVTGSHVGPGTIALFFCGSDGVREK